MPADKPKWGGRRVGPDGKPLGGRPRKPKSESIPAEPKAPAPKNLDLTRLAAMLPEIVEASRQHARTSRRTPKANPFQLPWFPKAALPPKKYQMAMDSMPVFADAATSWLAGGILNNAASEALLFPGYTYLSQLAQQPDFRNMAETIADDATRKWIKFEVTGNEEENEKRQAQDFADPDGSQKRRERRLKEKGKTDKVKALNDYMQKLSLQKIFFDLCRDDGFFGRTHLYLNFGDDVGMNSPELKTPIGDGRDALSRSKVGKDRPLRDVKTIEPLWAYPTTYNAQNPLALDWYDPTVWYVMGTQIHASRLLRFIGRPVPDILKPAYAFGGVSLSQLISPSVDIWIRTRNSVSELVHAFSVMVLSTDLSTMLQPGTATSLLARATLFNALRDNQNLMIVNKATEDFKNVSASIAGLDDLQAQAQEHVASTGRVPLVKYTGLQPKGLNASAEGEIAVYDDTIMAYQNRFIRPNLTTVFNFMQLSLWGEIDEEITFEFEPLRVMTEKERSEKQKADAERDGMRLDQGAISPEEVRKIIISDPDLPYTDLDPDEMPEPPEEEGIDPEGAIGKGGEEPGGEDHAVIPFSEGATDEWNEGDHPRGQPGNAGQFGPGGGGSKTGPKQSESSKVGPGGVHAPQFGIHHGSFTASSLAGFAPSSHRKSNIGEELDASSLKKVGEQMGSNPGGVFEDDAGKKFYVKKGKSKEHVRNEMIAAALYDLAGTPTLQYRPVKDGTHVATEIEKLSKDNASKLSKAEKSEAARDFAVHAWLANWDAVGLGGDNLGTVKGVPTALDLGGALEYRAQGAPKGKAFGKDVTELDTLRDAKVNKDAAGIFGDMTPSEMRESARYVTRIPDAKIKAAVQQLGGDEQLANKLIARKNDIAERARYFGQEGDPTSKDGTLVVPEGSKLPVKELNGVKFGAWRPPADWGAVDGQDLYDEPEFDPGKKKPSSGVVIREPDGRVWLMQPRGGYGGYEATFPKGGLETGLSLQANAIKEAYEETGLKVRITGFAGDHEGDVTVTRFYHAVREGGDPSKHEDESEGVVLAPKKKAEQFLNRKRDREVLAHDALFNDPDEDTAYWLRSVAEERRERALLERERRLPPVVLEPAPGEEKGEGEVAEDEFKETDHPRDPDGQFTDGGGGSSSGGGKSEKGSGPLAEEKPFWGLWQKPPGGSKEGPAAIVHNVEHFGNAPSKAGKPYRTVLAFLIKQAQALGGEKPIIDGLKVKLFEGLYKSMHKSVAEGKQENAQKLSKTLDKFKKTDKALVFKAAVNVGETLATAPAPTPKPAPAPPPPPVPTKLPSEVGASANFGTPTEAELAKAKKTVALQIQYVPNAAQLETTEFKASAQKLVNVFNTKYAGKELTSQPALIQKVNDFKGINHAIGALAQAEAEKLGPEKAKAKAAALAQQQEAAKKAAIQKAKQDAQFAEMMKDPAYAALKGVGGQPNQHYANVAKQHGIDITPTEGGLLGHYIGSGYLGVNPALYEGTISKDQYAYRIALENTLKKFPKIENATVTRGLKNISAKDWAKYQTGNVVPSPAFMSAGKTGKLWGEYTLKINSKTARDISMLNGEGGGEVIFLPHTAFHVISKSGNKAVLEEI